MNLLHDGEDCEKAELGHSSPFPVLGAYKTIIE